MLCITLTRFYIDEPIVLLAMCPQRNVDINWDSKNNSVRNTFQYGIFVELVLLKVGYKNKKWNLHEKRERTQEFNIKYCHHYNPFIALVWLNQKFYKLKRQIRFI